MTTNRLIILLQDGITLSESALKLEIEDAKREAFDSTEQLQEANLRHKTTAEQLELRVERAESHNTMLQRKVTYLEEELKRNVGLLTEKQRALEVCIDYKLLITIMYRDICLFSYM